MKKYLRAVKRHLNMPKELKDRVIHDLQTSISSRQESGQSDDQIMQELGDPKQAAAELNQQMKEYTYQKSPWRWACVVLMIVSILLILFRGALGLWAAMVNFQANHSIGIIGGADGPTAIFISAPEGYFIQQIIIAGIMLVMSILGYWALSHIRRK